MSFADELKGSLTFILISELNYYVTTYTYLQARNSSNPLTDLLAIQSRQPNRTR